MYIIIYSLYIYIYILYIQLSDFRRGSLFIHPKHALQMESIADRIKLAYKIQFMQFFLQVPVTTTIGLAHYTDIIR